MDPSAQIGIAVLTLFVILVLLASRGFARLVGVGLLFVALWFAVGTPAGSRATSEVRALIQRISAESAWAEQRPVSDSSVARGEERTPPPPVVMTGGPSINPQPRRTPVSSTHAPTALDDAKTLGQGFVENGKMAYRFMRADNAMDAFSSSDPEEVMERVERDGMAADRTLDRIEGAAQRIGSLFR